MARLVAECTCPPSVIIENRPVRQPSPECLLHAWESSKMTDAQRMMSALLLAEALDNVGLEVRLTAEGHHTLAKAARTLREAARQYSEPPWADYPKED